MTSINGTLTDGETQVEFNSEFDFSTHTGYVSRIDHFSVSKALYENLPRVVLADEYVQIHRVSYATSARLL